LRVVSLRHGIAAGYQVEVWMVDWKEWYPASVRMAGFEYPSSFCRSTSMAQSSSDISKGTQVMSLFAQILSGLGFVLIIIGAVLIIMDLFQEFAGEDGEFEMATAFASAGIMFYGMMLAALGQALTALRSIAINCAVIAEKN
jgi:hypothetical protein